MQFSKYFSHTTAANLVELQFYFTIIIINSTKHFNGENFISLQRILLGCHWADLSFYISCLHLILYCPKSVFWSFVLLSLVTRQSKLYSMSHNFILAATVTIISHLSAIFVWSGIHGESCRSVVYLVVRTFSHAF